jgi:hypothetical protein
MDPDLGGKKRPTKIEKSTSSANSPGTEGRQAATFMVKQSTLLNYHPRPYTISYHLIHIGAHAGRENPRQVPLVIIISLSKRIKKSPSQHEVQNSDFKNSEFRMQRTERKNSSWNGKENIFCCEH